MYFCAVNWTNRSLWRDTSLCSEVMSVNEHTAAKTPTVCVLMDGRRRITDRNLWSG